MCIWTNKCSKPGNLISVCSYLLVFLSFFFFNKQQRHIYSMISDIRNHDMFVLDFIFSDEKFKVVIN